MADLSADFLGMRLGGRVPTGKIMIPGGLVSIEADAILCYEFGKVQEKKPSASLLNSFVSLWKEQKPRDVVAFAEKWGPLRINDPKVSGQTSWGEEPLADWWFLSRRAYAVLRIAQALRDNKRGAEEDWRLLSTQYSGQDPSQAAFRGLSNWARWDPSSPLMKGFGNALYYERVQIGGEITEWMKQFGVALALGWEKSSHAWQLEVSYHGARFLGAVALQLALSVAGAESLFTCAGCGRPYIRAQRKPNDGQANYCETCATTRKPQREAEKRYRANLRTARAMAAKGASVEEIAQKLDRAPAVVRGWLQKGK